MAFQGFLRQSQVVDVLIGPFVDDGDGKTAETGLTIAQADVRLSKNGQNMAQKSDNTTCQHDELGMYNCELDETDTDTVGQLTISIHESGALPVRLDYHVVEEAIYDAMYGASATGELLVDVVKVSGDATAANNLELMYDGTGYAGGTAKLGVDVVKVSGDSTAADNLESACDNYSATRGLSGTALPAAAADAAGGLPISDGGGLALDTQLANTNEITAARMGALTDWINGGRLDLLLDAVKVVTDAISTNGSGLSAIPWNSAWDAEVQSECDDALVAKGLDHLLAASVAGSDITDNSIIAKLVSKESTADWDDFANTTDSLQAIRDRGDAAWVTATGFSTHTAANVRTEMDSNSTQLTNIVADTAELQTDNVPGLISTLSGKVDVIDGIVDDILLDTAEIGTGGAGLDDLGGMSSAMKAEINTEVDTAFTTQMPDSVAAHEAIPTREQALYMIVQILSEMAVSSTTMTVKKVDGSTSLMTFTLSDATNPTSITRAT